MAAVDTHTHGASTQGFLFERVNMNASPFRFNRDVNQVINPWHWFTRVVGGGQFGLINIVLGKTQSPEVEEEILDDVGSYGRQLGRLGDALDAVLVHMKVDTWDQKGQDAVADFRAQLREIRRIKAKHERLSNP